MSTSDPRSIRRRILLFLYERYQEDPLQMLSPEDFLSQKRFAREELSPNVHYLRERGLIELLIGYNPPLFAAARISPAGIDIVEDVEAFDQRFPPESKGGDNHRSELLALALAAAEEFESGPMSAVRRRWIVEEFNELRTLMRRADGVRNRTALSGIVEAIDHLAGEITSQSWAKLKARLVERAEE